MHNQSFPVHETDEFCLLLTLMRNYKLSSFITTQHASFIILQCIVNTLPYNLRLFIETAKWIKHAMTSVSAQTQLNTVWLWCAASWTICALDIAELSTHSSVKQVHKLLHVDVSVPNETLLIQLPTQSWKQSLFIFVVMLHGNVTPLEEGRLHVSKKIWKHNW